MDISNGHIGLKDDLLKQGSNPDDLLQIYEHDMTKKQRELGQVSLHDHKSVLGKILTKNQEKARRRKLRNK